MKPIRMGRAGAIIERELIRFGRSKALIIMSLTAPLVQLVVLGYAFGGAVKHLKLGVVDQDGGIPAVKLRELTGAVAVNAQTFTQFSYADMGHALADLKNRTVELRRYL